MSREEKQLRESLPEWRRTLANMPPSRLVKRINSGTITLSSALVHRQEGPVSAVMMDEIVIGARGGGKTMMAIAMHEQTYREYERVRAANRRPTGKRAQRARNKPWKR